MTEGGNLELVRYHTAPGLPEWLLVPYRIHATLSHAYDRYLDLLKGGGGTILTSSPGALR